KSITQHFIPAWSRICCSSSAQGVAVRCSVAPVGALHPVHGLLERFEAGPGCAARERGNKETHVIAVRRVTNSPENKVTVLLNPLVSASDVESRADFDQLTQRLKAGHIQKPYLTLNSMDGFFQSLYSCGSTRDTLQVQVRQIVEKDLAKPSSLLPVALSLYMTDPTLPAVCQLQSMFLSPNYMTSELQPQEVQGCADASAGGISPEVHVLKLHSAGSGSLQVEVIISLVPLVASKMQTVVLILSSSVPINWAIVAPGVRGHVSVHVRAPSLLCI
uniref:TGFBR3/Endoglin-like N-terminal domain-containing protein n=1 Tax=Sander lucioperca TaxID=283035 RepID=A0A8C9ZXK5_SANLU